MTTAILAICMVLFAAQVLAGSSPPSPNCIKGERRCEGISSYRSCISDRKGNCGWGRVQHCRKNYVCSETGNQACIPCPPGTPPSSWPESPQPQPEPTEPTLPEETPESPVEFQETPTPEVIYDPGCETCKEFDSICDGEFYRDCTQGYQGVWRWGDALTPCSNCFQYGNVAVCGQKPTYPELTPPDAPVEASPPSEYPVYKPGEEQEDCPEEEQICRLGQTICDTDKSLRICILPLFSKRNKFDIRIACLLGTTCKQITPILGACGIWP
eukprot:TRINITY_DN7181_c0_g1_i2.p1 TRINITY_DN7181_c0_g1~~TRINITY_DN7181_c0_g1_i2.p1  ORF type:complete len:278 (-),score=34.41 TRINITY_DN7181_c0_g1_i2:66-875(-)